MTKHRLDDNNAFQLPLGTEDRDKSDKSLLYFSRPKEKVTPFCNAQLCPSVSLWWS